MKKIIALTLCVLLLLSPLSLVAFAKATAPIHDYYAKAGTYKVTTALYKSGEVTYDHYKIWYPAAITASSKKFPLIVYCNATGCTYSTIDVPEHLEHIASWGFVVIANDQLLTGSGASASKGLDFMVRLSKTKGSIFYKKIDTNNVGLNGHSQGGTATINAASKGKFSNSDMFKAICAVSVPNGSLAASVAQNTPYDPSKVTCPAFLIAGTGAMEAGICPLNSVVSNFRKMSNSKNVMGRITGQDHLGILDHTTAYTTAWFRYVLCGDTYAARAFQGSGAEILTNSDWQNVYTKQTGSPATSAQSSALAAIIANVLRSVLLRLAGR